LDTFSADHAPSQGMWPDLTCPRTASWWRRWASYAIALPLFLLCLYFFFENFARFVPGNI